MSEAPPPLALGHEAAPDNPMGRLQDVHRTSSTLQLPGTRVAKKAGLTNFPRIQPSNLLLN